MENENKNQKEAEKRFEKRKEDTLEKVIIGGKNFSTTILDKMKSVIYSQEEKEALAKVKKENLNEIEEKE